MPTWSTHKRTDDHPTKESHRTFSRVLVPLFLATVALAAYLNADHEKFLFDSGEDHIIRTEHTEGPIKAIKYFWQGRLNPDAPFTYLTFAWNYSFNRAIGLDGFDSTAFLIINVLIHALNGWLVYLLVGAMFRQVEPDRPKPIWIPLVLATLFTVHPLQASSVAYIIQRRGALAATFYLLAVLCYLKVRRPAEDQGRSASPGFASAWTWKGMVLTAVIPILYWLSVRSKNLGVTLPFALLAVEFCLRASDWRALKRYLMLMIPGFVLCTIGMFVFLWMRGLFDPRTFTIHYFGPSTTWGVWPHLLTEARVFVHYWKLLLLPLPRWCCIDHDFTLSKSLFDHYAIAAIAFHVLLLALVVVFARRRYILAALGILWFYIALIPYAALPQRELFVEYKTYLPSVGLVLILAEVLRYLRGRVSAVVPALVVAAWAAILLTTTIHRNVIYQNAVNLWSDAVEKYPRYHRPQYNLGYELAALGRSRDAIIHYQEAVKYKSDFSDRAHYNLAVALERTNQPLEALKHYREALRLNPNYLNACNNLGVLLAKMGKYEESIALFKRSIELAPNYINAYDNMGGALRGMGRINEAIEYYKKALQMDPNLYSAHCNLADTLMEKGEYDQAVVHYKEVLRIRPYFKRAAEVLKAALAKKQSNGRQ
ncbi:MAG: tetratricopeptide repeat protein [Planctomycetota bacterium]|nr:MAG: tetratricopeptide repeat protein [Planctomycetota bacterium]